MAFPLTPDVSPYRRSPAAPFSVPANQIETPT